MKNREIDRQMTLFPVLDLPLIEPGDDVAALIVEHLQAQNEHLEAGDIVVIAQKIVSKAENRLIDLREVEPNEQALALAQQTDKDPRAVQVVLDDSNEIIRTRRGVLIVEQKSGWISANAGVDHSNVADDEDGKEILALLPEDADLSAEQIRQRLHELTGISPAVIINDSHGRPWRIGTVGVCIGCAGLPPLWDQRGLYDLYGYELHGSEECLADELASAATLLMGQSDEGRPVVIVRGYQWPDGLVADSARSIQRPAQMDMFR